MQPTDLIDSLRYARDQIAPDVTVQRLLVLLTVARYPGLSQTELGRHLPGISTTAMSRNLADLSERTSQRRVGPGLIELKTDPENLRRKRVRLTARGKQLLRGWQKTMP